MFGFSLDDVLEVGAGVVTGGLGATVAANITKEVTGSDSLSALAGIAGGIAAGSLGSELMSSFLDDE